MLAIKTTQKFLLIFISFVAVLCLFFVVLFFFVYFGVSVSVAVSILLPLVLPPQGVGKGRRRGECF